MVDAFAAPGEDLIARRHRLLLRLHCQIGLDGVLVCLEVHPFLGCIGDVCASKAGACSGGMSTCVRPNQLPSRQCERVRHSLSQASE